MKVVLGILSFIYKVYVGFIFVVSLCIFYFPIRFFLLKEKRKRKAHRLFVIWSRCVQVAIFIPFKIQQKGKLPDGQIIICANHSSYLDIILLPSLMSHYPFIFVGKHEVLGYPLIKTFFKLLHISVDRSSKIQSARSFVKINRAYKEGWSIAIFPEGGIPDDNRPKMAPFKNGAFKLAMDNKATIVPITFMNNYCLLSDPSDILGLARPGYSKVIIHEAITSEMYALLSLEELNKKVFSIINEPLIELY
ncbi:MAG: lysophospholipid acyltransferase family protein [Crocinitomicaceae bacterium]